MRWLYHVLPLDEVRGEPYAPSSLAAEGYVHCSFRDAVTESARLYFPADARLLVLRIDPRRLDARVEVVETPRGPMPHVYGAIPEAAIVEEIAVARFDDHGAPDTVDGSA